MSDVTNARVGCVLCHWRETNPASLEWCPATPERGLTMLQHFEHNRRPLIPNPHGVASRHIRLWLHSGVTSLQIGPPLARLPACRLPWSHLEWGWFWSARTRHGHQHLYHEWRQRDIGNSNRQYRLGRTRSRMLLQLHETQRTIPT